MKDEEILEIGITDLNRLYLKTKACTYPLIYREAAEIDWDKSLNALVGGPKREMTFVFWFLHIFITLKNLGYKLHITQETYWENIPADLMNDIKTAYAEQCVK